LVDSIHLECHDILNNTPLLPLSTLIVIDHYIERL